jgi:UDP-3-O-[3-hydroxymyristoyl] glucosamine N-acyltransferase
MTYSVAELSKLLDLNFSGNGDTQIDHACGIDNIKSGGLAYITNPSELANLPTPKGIFDSRQTDLNQIQSTEGSAIIVPIDARAEPHTLIYSDDPIFHHAKATELLHKTTAISHSLHPQATLGKDVVLGEGVTIDAQVVIYDNVTVGNNTIIRAGTVIMDNCIIGEDCLIYPNVSLRENCRIGNRVIIHPGAVLGADGYGYFQRSGKNFKLPQIGGVIIEDDVEIGACTTIDRARFEQTIIGRGSKLDNLVHIAHNVKLGEDSLITAQSGIAGSTSTGHHLIMGGQSGIRDNLKIGDNVTLLARTLVTSKTDDHTTVAGMPSRPIRVWRQIQALINNLDGLFERIKVVEKRIQDTEK